ncbi:MAG: DNA mismatch repair protein MutS [Paludibacteraceae bacterium]|nr:DNA mismatch repair protein MutS [Paludibacteraceae bacterium]
MAKSSETPLMRQYFETKKLNPDAVLLFRVGDFYETYGPDAVIAAEVLGITLTKRSSVTADSIELAGFPHHALDNYLPKLVRAGYRVAVCDQLEDPKTTKTLVKRGITELVTPGVAYNDNVLDTKSNNFVAAVHAIKSLFGISFLDISTGEFLVAEGSAEYVEKLIGSIAPKELLTEKGKDLPLPSLTSGKYSVYRLDDWVFTGDAAEVRLLKQFDTASLKGFGVSGMTAGIVAAGAILHYLDQTQHLQTGHITSLSRLVEDRYVWMDKFTIRNLELFAPSSGEGKSLMNILDLTLTPMGGRLLKRWVAFPLKDKDAIENRQNQVDSFFKETALRETLIEQLPQIGDLERISSKVAVGRITPREMAQLKCALQAIARIKTAYQQTSSETAAFGDGLNDLQALAQLLEERLVPNPPIAVNRGTVIRDGVSEELDHYRQLANGGREYIEQLQNRESERTGIPSLKISYNNVFGYYIEVRNTHKDKVPPEWIRKQTLVNAERYITAELKKYEEEVLGATERIQILETQLFAELVETAAKEVPILQQNASKIATVDVLLSFAERARQSNYVRPVIANDRLLEIKQGRHPVIESLMPVGESYIANDVTLDAERQQIIIITGPNMAGKSALLRQTALITLMAQIGSYVPAEAAHIGLVDKIFTRVGASDNISMGESTFMVEMTEAATILNNATPQSLVLFDELGRGTSTYDGISIAWSIVEYLHEQPTAAARTLFATHYHELNEMESSFARIKNFNVSVKEEDGKVIFLRKLVPGGSEHSFGIEVAKLAGMPKSIVKRANEVLADLENAHREDKRKHVSSKPVKEIANHREGMQLSIFQLDDPVLMQVRDTILNVDIDRLTPLDALNKLSEIKRILNGK